MRYEDWEPYYREILEEFGYSEEEDRRSAKRLAELTGSKRVPASEVENLVEGEPVTVVGNAPSLPDELEAAEPSDVIFAADGATSVLLSRGVVPDVVVSDLDGDPGRLPKAEMEGTVINVHAHGDNLGLIETWVPMLSRVFPTCQCRPFDGLYNFGGFTDGDRAAFMADELGASSLELLGFDFESYSTEEKGRKLRWAKRLLDLLDLQYVG